MPYAPPRFGRFGLACAHLFGGRSRHGVRVRGMLGCRPGGPLFIALGTLSTLIAVVLVLAGLLAARLAQGPIPLEMLKAPMTEALEKRVGNGYKFDVGNVLMEQGPEGFGLIIQSLTVKDAQGRQLLAAPKALVGLDLLALMTGDVKPTRLELADLEVRVAVTETGAIALTAGTEEARAIDLPVAPGPAAPVVKKAAIATATAPLRSLATAIATTVDLATVEKSALGALVRVGIAHGRLVIDDRTAGRTTVFSGFDLAFDRDEPGRAQLTVAANGPNGRWSVKVVAAETAERGRVLDLNFRDLSLAEFMLAGGMRALPFATEMPVSGNASFDLDSRGALKGAAGDFGLGAGVLRIDDPDQKPFHIDEVTGHFRLDPGTARIAFDKVQYFAQETHLALKGVVDVPEAANGPWAFAFQGDGAIAPARSNEKPLQTAVDFAGRWDPATSKLKAERLALKGPAIDLDGTADLTVGGEGPHLLIRVVNRGAMPVSAIAALWPTYVQVKLRQWLVEHLAGGTLERGAMTFDCTAACFDDYKAKRPMPVEALAIDLAVSDMSLAGMKSVPPLAGIVGTAKVGSRWAKFSGPTAEVRLGDQSLQLADWTFDIPDTVPKQMPVTATARVQAGVAAIRQMLKSKPLTKYVKLPPDVPEVHGHVDARLGLDFTIGGDDEGPPPAFSGTAKVSNFGVDKFVGDEKIENCTMNVSLDESGVRARGEGRIFGAPGTLELRKPSSGQGEAIIQATFDDAARAKRGLALGSKLTGPVVVRISAPLGRDKPKAQVEADLSRTSINNLLPGWTKAAGRPAKATFTLAKRQDNVMLDQFVLDGGGITMRGSAELSSAGALISAKLSQLRIGGGDDMKVEATRSGEGLRVSVRAGTLDVRPLLRNLSATASGAAAKSGAAADTLDTGKALDLELKAQTVIGQNQRAMKAVELRVVKKGTTYQQLRFSARIGHGTLTARLDPGAQPLLTIATGDAGAALSFFDFYKHMDGGRLEAAIRMTGDNSQEGSASVDQFVLRNEPAISRVSAEAEQQGGQVNSINLNPALVRFARFQTVFSRGAGKVSLRDTVMWGDEIGATVEGSVDFARDYVSLHGTFVPAYALNNMFAKIPFFGPLLGGGANEGLFAVNYRVSGAASAPTVSINLLTAIAPGFLRQIFGAIDGGGTGSYRPDASAYAPPQRQMGFPDTGNN